VSQRELVLAAFPSCSESLQGVSCCRQSRKQTINNVAKEEAFQGSVPLQPERDYQPTALIFVLYFVGCFTLFFKSHVFFSKRKNICIHI